MLPGIGREGRTRIAQRILGENTRHETIMVVACHYTFVKPLECSTPGMSSRVKLQTQVIMMCQCRFINYNKYTTLVGYDNGEAVYMWLEYGT